jgi:alkaline phosphatase
MPRERYSDADLLENPTLAEMTAAALKVLSTNEHGFWMILDSGDVDWANHGANIDDSIGAVISGDEAVRVITDWVEAHSNWRESLLIVTADHGHYLRILNPELLAEPLHP